MEDVTSAVPQGSELVPILFLVYVDDTPLGTNSYINSFGGDAT